VNVRKAAVIVPVHEDPEGLATLLEHVARQDFPAERLEVIVAVDGGDPQTLAVAEGFGARTVALVPNQGSYTARNRAIEMLSDDVDVVAFTDGDCRPWPGWISAHVAALADADMSGGAVDVTLSARPQPAEFIDRLRHLQQKAYVTQQGYAATANLAVRRDVLRAMRFDSSLRTGGDVEFGQRATAAGFRLVYSPDAGVDHPARETTAELFRKIERICTGMTARRAYWQGRVVSPPRFKKWLAQRAVHERVSRNPIWLARMLWLERECQRRVAASAVAAGGVIAPKRALTVGYVVDRPAELTQTFVTGELEELRRQGARVVIVALRPARNAVPPQVPTLVLQDLGVSTRVQRLARRAWRLLDRRRWGEFEAALGEVASEIDGPGVPRSALPYAGWWLRRQRVHVLHAHFGWRAAAAAHALSRLTGRPWTMTLHARDIFSDRHNLDAKLAAAARVVTVCDYNRRFLRNELGVTRPIDLVICGVEPAAPPRPSDVGCDVVAVGRLVEKKGFDLLLESVAKLRTARELRVRIIGDGPLQSQLQARAVELGIADIVEFAGPRSHEQTLSDIAAARLLCLPARIAANGDRDSMPVVVKEAMAAGVPVVATDVVAIPEMVDDTVGRLVPPEDPDALAAGITAILDLDDAAYEKMSVRARARVDARFTMAQQVRVLREILTAVAKERA